MDSRNTDALDTARGDVGLSRYLHRAFTQIRNSEFADASTRAALDKVLSGHASLREFGRSEEFARLAERVPDSTADSIAGMSEQRRDQLAAAAQAMLDQLAAQATEPPPTREPARSADADDDYFEARRRSGWLE